MNTQIQLTELESAINFWRQKHPSQGEEMTLCPQASALAKYYALMIVTHAQQINAEELDEKARRAFEGWQQALGRSS